MLDAAPDCTSLRTASNCSSSRVIGYVTFALGVGDIEITSLGRM